MNKRSLKDRKRGKATAMVLTVLLLLIPAVVFGKTGRGATVIVSLKGGDRASGELIQVKLKSILVLLPSGQDSSLDLSEILRIRVIRDPRVAQGSLIGLLAGLGTGFLGGSAALKGEDPCQSVGPKLAYFYGGGIVGLIAGGIIGASAGKDIDIQIDGASPQALEGSLRKMGKYARVKGVA